MTAADLGLVVWGTAAGLLCAGAFCACLYWVCSAAVWWYWKREAKRAKR